MEERTLNPFEDKQGNLQDASYDRRLGIVIDRLTALGYPITDVNVYRYAKSHGENWSYLTVTELMKKVIDPSPIIEQNDIVIQSLKEVSATTREQEMEALIFDVAMSLSNWEYMTLGEFRDWHQNWMKRAEPILRNLSILEKLPEKSE